MTAFQDANERLMVKVSSAMSGEKLCCCFCPEHLSSRLGRPYRTELKFAKMTLLDLARRCLCQDILAVMNTFPPKLSSHLIDIVKVQPNDMQFLYDAPLSEAR